MQHPQRRSPSLKSRLADDGSLLDAMILHGLERQLMLDLCSDFRQCPSGTDGVIIELTLGRNLLPNVADHSINAEEWDAVDQIERAMTIAA